MKTTNNKQQIVLIYEDEQGTQWYSIKGTKTIHATRNMLYEGIDTKKIHNIDIINSPYSIETEEDIEDLVNE